MRIVRGLPSYPREAAPSAVALGVFDGVHLGHRAILGTATARAAAAGLTSIACTFDPHPMEVLHPGQAPVLITTLEERLELMAESGLDTTLVLTFDAELAALEPETFVKDVLVDRLRAAEVVVGFNHRFGRGARGDARLLEGLGQRIGFQVHVVPPLAVDGVPVSSTEIRGALRRGDLAAAARLLGRPYFVRGVVTRGAGRGRTLGFPTANLAPDRPLLVPTGVYACGARVDGAAYAAVVNVGVRPTFESAGIVVEAHLLDAALDLYGRRLALDFVARLREERKFPSVEDLRAQIARDVEAARARLRSLYFPATPC
ncbi:MAG TPA: bifunctional riboflavin kinase/FAD synthetase [Candidatus Tectomicrobia bacterium]|nr:bifunctional riboflavin kinase/FAD synthetase [Candidatus Tectomicrobia bacterium]